VSVSCPAPTPVLTNSPTWPSGSAKLAGDPAKAESALLARLSTVCRPARQAGPASTR